MEIFGYKITRSSEPPTEKSFVAPTDDGGTDEIKAGGYYGTYLDLDGTASTEHCIEFRNATSRACLSHISNRRRP